MCQFGRIGTRWPAIGDQQIGAVEGGEVGDRLAAGQRDGGMDAEAAHRLDTQVEGGGVAPAAIIGDQRDPFAGQGLRHAARLPPGRQCAGAGEEAAQHRLREVVEREEIAAHFAADGSLVCADGASLAAGTGCGGRRRGGADAVLMTSKSNSLMVVGLSDCEAVLAWRSIGETGSPETRKPPWQGGFG